MFELPDPVPPTTEHPPPEELEVMPMEPLPDDNGAATPTGSTRTPLPSTALSDELAAAWVEGLPPVTVSVTVFPAMTAEGTSWNPSTPAWYTLLPGGMGLGKVTVT